MDLKNKKILLTGGNGFLGTFVKDALIKEEVKIRSIYSPSSEELDFTKWENCVKAVRDKDIVIHLAALVGGIGLNQARPGELFYVNLIMGAQLMEAAQKAGVKKFVSIGTVCAYPKFTPVPFKEKDLWAGYPEETNAPYGLAKKMLLVQGDAYKQQYNFNSIFLLPVNLYGPGDNFNPKSSHVIPALMRKFIEARENGLREVVVWGTGKATREFLYVGDAARAIVLATKKYNKSDPVNVGASFEVSIKELANKIAKLTGFKGKIVWDKSKPDGQPRRKLDVSLAKKEFGFVSKIKFDEGLKKTYEWYSRYKNEK